MEALKEVRSLIRKSHTVIPDGSKMYLSHHYGEENFITHGATIIECFNIKHYAKKIIVVLPKQKHPPHFHHRKHETFHVLYGDLTVKTLGGTKESPNDGWISHDMIKGNWLSVDTCVYHGFTSINGCVFEEISTHQYDSDSVYVDRSIMDYKDRKTFVKEFK